jgi:hypothetical protein
VGEFGYILALLFKDGVRRRAVWGHLDRYVSRSGRAQDACKQYAYERDLLGSRMHALFACTADVSWCLVYFAHCCHVIDFTQLIFDISQRLDSTALVGF